MTEEKSLAVATAGAASRGLRWVEPAAAVLRLVGGRRSWFVPSNSHGTCFKGGSHDRP